MAMRNYQRFFMQVAGLGFLAAVLAGSPVVGAEKAKITLNWLPGEASIGIIYADALGYYKDAGIELEIEPGKGSGTTSQLVAAGNTDIGFASGPSAIAIAAKGAPVKIIAPIYQAAEFGIISLKDTPISSPKDLEGKTIALAAGSADVPLFEAMLKANGVDKSKINIVSADGATFIGLLAERKVDGVSDTPSEVIVPLAEKGIDSKILYYKEYGAPLVGLSIIARDDKITENPDLYKKFLDATLRGYAAVIKNPEAAVDAVLAKYPDAEKRERLLQGLIKYSIPAYCMRGATGLGRPPAELWDVTEKVLAESLGPLGESGIKGMYTNDLLPAEVPPCP